MLQSEIDTIIYLISDKWLRDDDDAEYTQSWQDYATRCRTLASPLAVHCLAANLNWDYGVRGPQTVIDHPFCDRGTALMIYWLGEPGHLNIMDPSIAAMLNALRKRYLSDAFTSRTIAADPHDILGTNKLEAGDTSEIPQPLKTPTQGIDATPHIHAVRVLAAIDRVRRGQITAANLVASIDQPSALQRIDPETVARIRSLCQRMRTAGRLPSVFNPLLDETESVFVSIVL